MSAPRWPGAGSVTRWRPVRRCAGRRGTGCATGRDRIEADPAAERDWGEHNRAAADATLLPRAASSWYLGANVPGKPSVFMPYAGGFARYAATCADVAADGYRGFRLSGRGPAA